MWGQKDDRKMFGAQKNQSCGLLPKDQGDRFQGRPDSCCDSAKGRNCAEHCPGACEPLWAAALGIKYLDFYIGGSPPNDQRWGEIEKSLREGNTLIHCKAGTDRTGAVVGRWMKVIGAPEARSDFALLDYVRNTGSHRQPTKNCKGNKGESNPCGWDKRNPKLKYWMIKGRRCPSGQYGCR
jgi:hypothetical protein